MPEIFFISDTHFGHEKIIEFEAEKRPFKDISEHDAALVENWNKVVGKNDIVYHLGDVVFGRDRNFHQLLQLNGIKKLILGNHDRFAKLYPYFHSFAGAIKFEGLVLTHIPCASDSLGHRFKCNIHGHLHSSLINDPRYINVSCEQINLTPINFEVLKERITQNV